MIAPLKDSTWQSTTAEPRLRLARRLLAGMLLAERDSAETPAVPTWQAWLACTWVVIVAVAYLASIVRSFQ